MANVLEKFIPAGNQPKVYTADFNQIKDGWVKCDVSKGALVIKLLSDNIDNGRVEIVDNQLETTGLLKFKYVGNQAPKFD